MLHDAERFLVFGTEKNLSLLENADIFCDGTFDCSPKLFDQVYSIHALVNGRCVPIIYACLSRRTEVLYVRFLTIIKDKLKTMPNLIMSDFEKSFLNAIEKVFPTVKLQGCYFHFKQSMYRKINKLGTIFVIRTY